MGGPGAGQIEHSGVRLCQGPRQQKKGLSLRQRRREQDGKNVEQDGEKEDQYTMQFPPYNADIAKNISG